LLVLLIAIGPQVSQRSAHAQTVPPSTEFLVNSTEDKVDADFSDDVCDADPGPAVQCTLRAAIIQANLTPDQQVIRLQAQVYRLTIPGANEAQSFTGDLDVRDAVQIIGTTSGRARSTIDATGLGDRVFDGLLLSNSSQWLLQQLTITGGQLPGTTGLGTEFDGGGIRNFSNLTIADSVIRNNAAARGGGIAQHGQQSLTIERSTISDNRAIGADTPSLADGGGGILQANARLTLRDSTVQNNISASQGGGLSLLPFAQGSVITPVRIERSLIAGNSAQVNGGGISVEGKNGGSVVIENSTVSTNFATTQGGGIDVRNLQLPVVLRATTIAGNRSQHGGGVMSDDKTTAATIEATNSIFSNNVGGNCDFEQVFRDSSFNLSSDSLCSFHGANNHENVGAKLGPLQFNGGPTQTHALLTGSPAIDAGGAAGCPATDQRGVARPQNGTCDIGAYEVAASELPPTATPSATLPPKATPTPIISDPLPPRPTAPTE
jgi:CSLREA domain-containing protein